MKTDKLIKIIKLGRFQFIFGGFLYFCLGAFFAVLLNAEFALNKFLLGYAIFFTAHLSMHYSNDYFDMEADKHGKTSQFAGGSGILIENPELKNFSKWFSITLLSLSLIFAAVFVAIFSYSIWFFLFVVFGNLLAWFYAAPPIKLSYNGLGELATIFIGFMMPGMGYLTLMGTINMSFVIFSIPLLLYQLLFITAVQIPDMEGDKLGGKITWIVKKGRIFGFKTIAVAGSLATFSFIILSITNLYPIIINFKVIAFLSIIPLAFAILSYLKKSEDRITATKLVNQNLSSLILFLAITNCYFVYLIV
ncbi:MAG: prenyltransferase [Methanobacterium sp.]|uniref:prenyltransferase n=1 Tax=Methanobacterium sp. TaxID=2164 RepID=UPI003D66067E|nr:prenyltransferase [Methanobacterium sp.]